MITFIETEFLKLKRSKIFFITILGALFVPFMLSMGIAYQLWQSPDYIFYFKDGFEVMKQFLFVLFGVEVFAIVSAYLFGREYSERTLKSILTTPISKIKYLCGKFLMFFIWTILLVLISYFGLILFGEVIGIKGLTNNYNFLINVRESMAADTKNYTVKSGKWYGIPSTSYDGSYHVPAPTVTVTTSQEKVDYSDLSASEKESADEQREQLILDEKKKNDEQQAIVTEDAQSLVEKIWNSEIVTQEQAEDFFSQNGGILDQGFVEDTITDYTKPQLTEQIDSEYAAREEQEAAEAAVAIEQERKEQADRYQEQLDVIQQGGSFVDTDPDYSSDPHVGNPTSNQVVEETTFEAPSIDYSSDPNVGNPAVDEQPQTNALPETSSAEATSLTQDTSNQVVEETTFEAPSIDYSSDPNVGNPAVDEQPYTESLPSAKEELQLMRNALADVNPEVLGLTGEVDLGYAKKLNL